MCFQHCVDNFFTRDLSAGESTCLDKCVLKFSNVNQRVMGTYIAEQSVINERRLKEVESQMRAQSGAAVLSNDPITTVDVMQSIAQINSETSSISEHIEAVDDSARSKKFVA